MKLILAGPLLPIIGAVRRKTAPIIVGTAVLFLPAYFMLMPDWTVHGLGNSAGALLVWRLMATTIWALLAFSKVTCIDLSIGKALVGLAVFWLVAVVRPLTDDWGLSLETAIYASVGGSVVGLAVLGILRRQLRIRKARREKFYDRVLREAHERDRPIR